MIEAGKINTKIMLTFCNKIKKTWAEVDQVQDDVHCYVKWFMLKKGSVSIEKVDINHWLKILTYI
jgi:hypothetical protein